MIECRCKTQSTRDPEVRYPSPGGVGTLLVAWRFETVIKAAVWLQFVLSYRCVPPQAYIENMLLNDLRNVNNKCAEGALLRRILYNKNIKIRISKYNFPDNVIYALWHVSRITRLPFTWSITVKTFCISRAIRHRP